MWRSRAGRHKESLMLHGAARANWDSNSRPPLSNTAVFPACRRLWRSEGKMAKLLVIGASRGIGLETVKAGLLAGHKVRALARSASRMHIKNTALDKVCGDAHVSDMIRNAVQEHEVVVPEVGDDHAW